VTLHSPLAPGEACRSRRQCALEHSCGGGCSRAANFHHIGADSIAGSVCGQNNTNTTCVPGVMEPAQVAMSSSSYGDSMFDQHPSAVATYRGGVSRSLRYMAGKLVPPGKPLIAIGRAGTSRPRPARPPARLRRRIPPTAPPAPRSSCLTRCGRGRCRAASTTYETRNTVNRCCRCRRRGRTAARHPPRSQLGTHFSARKRKLQQQAVLTLSMRANMESRPFPPPLPPPPYSGASSPSSASSSGGVAAPDRPLPAPLGRLLPPKAAAAGGRAGLLRTFLRKET